MYNYTDLYKIVYWNSLEVTYKNKRATITHSTNVTGYLCDRSYTTTSCIKFLALATVLRQMHCSIDLYCQLLLSFIEHTNGVLNRKD